MVGRYDKSGPFPARFYFSLRYKLNFTMEEKGSEQKKISIGEIVLRIIGILWLCFIALIIIIPLIQYLIINRGTPELIGLIIMGLWVIGSTFSLIYSWVDD